MVKLPFSGENSLIKNELNIDIDTLVKTAGDPNKCGRLATLLGLINPELLRRAVEVQEQLEKRRVRAQCEQKKEALLAEVERKEIAHRIEERLADEKQKAQLERDQWIVQSFIDNCKAVKNAFPFFTAEQVFAAAGFSCSLTPSEAKNLADVMLSIDAGSVVVRAEPLSPELRDGLIRGASHAYDNEIKALWKKVIEGVFSDSEQITKRALRILDYMTATELKSFEWICSTRTWKHGFMPGDPLIFNFDGALLGLINEGLTEGLVRELETLGLISISARPLEYIATESPTVFSRSGIDVGFANEVKKDADLLMYTIHGVEVAAHARRERVIKFYFGDSSYELSPIEKIFPDGRVRPTVNCGYVKLTTAGRQLAAFLEYKPANNIERYLHFSYETLRSLDG